MNRGNKWEFKFLILGFKGLKPGNFYVTHSLSLDKNNTIQHKQNNAHIWVWFLHSILTVYCNVTKIRVPGQEAPGVLILFLDD